MSSVQSDQARLVETAETLPGVRELAEVYERIAPFATTSAEATTNFVYYATGGNAS